MKAETSFSQKVREGDGLKRLMAYYALTETNTSGIMECLNHRQDVRI